MTDLREELLSLIEESDIGLIENIENNTSLIKSGIFDSRALFNLAAWIQEKVGSEMDFTKFDLAAEWDTIDNILNFIEGRRSN